jgi:hypothetical protein
MVADMEVTFDILAPRVTYGVRLPLHWASDRERECMASDDLSQPQRLPD